MEYREALQAAIDEWNTDPIADEWSFERFRDRFVRKMSAPVAFEAMDETVDFLLKEPDESTAIEILQTIIGLARQSETTEMPAALVVHWNAIEAKFLGFDEHGEDKLKELAQYYRLTHPGQRG